MPQWADNLDLLIQFTGRNYYPKSGIRHIAARLSKRWLWSEANTLELLAAKDHLTLKADPLAKVRKVRLAELDALRRERPERAHL